MEANLAVLIDFENIAAGTEKEGLGRFDVDALMKRLKDKGRILVSRSYADWGRFARFKQTLLSANVTMMELTSHGMQDKNRADIAMVVDCLELAFTKDYIDTFIVVSGDSDFTPLVLKMRELNKRVIGCGTRASTSRLLIQACDEFMFYDTIVKEARAAHARPARVKQAAGVAVPEGEEPFELLMDALEGIQRENPDPVHASIVKTSILRKSPDFNEVELGFSSFARFLESAQEAGYVKLSRDAKSGGYRVDSAEAAEPDRQAPPHGRRADDRRTSDERRGGDRGAERGAEAPPPIWFDSYLPEGTKPQVEALANLGLNPLAYPTRMALLQAVEEIAADRRKRRRRVNIQFVQEDMRKRLKKINPDLPGRAVKAVMNALLRGGLLLHKDGRPIRSSSAPFELDKNAEQLNKALTEVYLEALREVKADTSGAAPLAELFLGDKARRREIEQTLAWLDAPDEEIDEEEEELEPEADLSLDDDLLLTEEAPAQPQAEQKPVVQAEAAQPSEAAAEAAAEPEPEPEPEPAKRPTRRRRKAEPEAAAAVEPTEAGIEAAPADADEKKTEKRRRPRKKKSEEQLDDLDALLAED